MKPPLTAALTQCFAVLAPMVKGKFPAEQALTEILHEFDVTEVPDDQLPMDELRQRAAYWHGLLAARIMKL